MNFLKKHKYSLLGMVLGAFAGYLYYHFVGCENGTCAITSHPVNSTLYGAVIGALGFSMFQKQDPTSK